MAGRSSSRARHVALLRAINVGGRNRLPMKDLAAIFEEAGAADVRTYIQSGNVLFTAPASRVGAIAEEVRHEIEDRFGFDTPVITRSESEFAKVLDALPFADADPAALHVAFLDRRPRKNQATALDPDRSPGDALQLVGRELYLHLPNGVARSKLTTGYIDGTLDTTSTVRNWRTTTRLAAMLRAHQ